MGWYAFFVKTGYEDNIRKYINSIFDTSECYSIFPKKKLNERTKGIWREVLKPLFPGYILINSLLNDNLYYLIKNVPNIYYVLRCGNEHYTKIQEDEIRPILGLIGENDIIDYSKVLIENSKVYVISGPLKGLEGLVKKVDKRKGRAKIILNFLGSPKEIELGIDVLHYVS